MADIVCYDSNGEIITSIFQWDVDRQVRLEGGAAVDLTNVSAVHVTNKGQRNAVSVDFTTSGNGVVLVIPNYVLRKTADIAIYLVEDIADTEERTVYQVTIPLIARPMPITYSDSMEWSGAARIFDDIDLDDYLLAQEGNNKGRITVRKVLELSGIAELAAVVDGKQDALTAGENITITGNVISATGGGSADAVLYTEQSLTNAQKEQARDNINAASATTVTQIGNALSAVDSRVQAVETNAVRADEEQSFSAAEQAQARSNIGAGTYSKPSGGIPASDLASGVIPSVPSASSATPQALGTAAAGSSTDYSRVDHVHDFNDDFKAALLQLAAKVAYIDGDGQTYYDALEAALTHKVLSSITAVFTQGANVIYDTDTLDDLKQYLVVTAHYSDNSTATVTTYTLSGTLAVGTDTITVSYRGKTTTFTVTVISYSPFSFTGGVSLARIDNAVYRTNNNTTARACMDEPIANNGYSFTVTDSSKYAVAVNGVSSLDYVTVTRSGSVDGYGYPPSGNAPSWATSGSTQASYVWVALKKNDGTAFTDEELANGAAAVITYTENA